MMAVGGVGIQLVDHGIDLGMRSLAAQTMTQPVPDKQAVTRPFVHAVAFAEALPCRPAERSTAAPNARRASGKAIAMPRQGVVIEVSSGKKTRKQIARPLDPRSERNTRISVTSAR